MIRISCIALAILLVTSGFAVAAPAAIVPDGHHETRRSTHAAPAARFVAPATSELAALGSAGIALAPAERLGARGSSSRVPALVPRAPRHIWIFAAVIVAGLLIFLIVN